MNIFDESLYKARKGDGTVFKGLGIRHNDLASRYCDCPDDITISQSIAEAAILLRDIINENNDDNRLFWEKDGSYIGFDIALPREWRFENIVPLGYYGFLEGSRILAGGRSYNGTITENAPDGSEYSLDMAYIIAALIREIITDSRCCNAFTRLMYFVSQQTIAEFCASVMTEEKSCLNYLVGSLNSADIRAASFSFSDFRKLVIPAPDDFDAPEEEDEETDRELPAMGQDSDSEPLSTSGAAAVQTQHSKKKADFKISESSIIKMDRNKFAEEYHALIPSLPPEFVIPEQILAVCSAISSGDVTSVLIHGPAGTGKTMSCKLICQEIGLPIMETINCTENLDEFVLGKFLPENDRIVFRESYVTKAIRDGGAVVFEEINFAKPQYLSFLNSLLDDNGFVRLDNGQTVKRNKNFRFFATMNIGYFGTKELNQALFNRFGIVAELDELSDSAIGKMLAARVPECRNQISKILFVYHRIKNMFEQNGYDLVISPRNLESWARMSKYLGFVVAAEYTLISTARADRETEKAIRDIVSGICW